MKREQTTEMEGNQEARGLGGRGAETADSTRRRAQVAAGALFPGCQSGPQGEAGTGVAPARPGLRGRAGADPDQGCGQMPSTRRRLRFGGVSDEHVSTGETSCTPPCGRDVPLALVSAASRPPRKGAPALQAGVSVRTPVRQA